MANSNNWGEIYKSTWWGDEDWSANSLKIDSAPPGFAFTGLLDTYTGAAAAYSVRKLSSTYSGSALRVRKEVSSVDEETDIGFNASNELDTTALLSFASDADGGNVYVSIWYDQSGNTRNATNTTESEQPLVVSGGTLITENSKPTLQFDSSNDYLQTPFAAGVTNDWFVSCVQKFNNLSGIKYSYGGRDGSGDGPVVSTNNDRINARVVASIIQFSPITTNLFLYIQELSASNNTHTIYHNGTTGGSEAASSINTTTNIRLGQSSYLGAGNMNGRMSEIIFYQSDQRSNRTGIESNTATHYGITL